jgi:glycosyltransferase involved in cell wall biosynthesis
MLSILIPIYEVKIEQLVHNLKEQCRAADIEFEILCFDDCSSENVKKANRTVDSEIGVNYVELSENQGRAKIRNRLAKSAQYDYLLYLDADSKVLSNDLIENYSVHIAPETVVCGGRTYTDQRPKFDKKILHWKYGTKRESRSAEFRSKHKMAYFHSNNFVIDRKVMFENPFEEEIRGYGYEDLTLAYQLDLRGVDIVHIDNPIVHDRLEDTEVFLNKSLQATENLFKLYKSGKIPYTRLIKAYKFLDAYYLKDSFLSFYSKWKDRIESNLKSKTPKMYYLDLYKLNHFVQTAVKEFR